MRVLQAIDVGKQYVLGDRTLDVLQGVSLDIDAGASVAIVGPSGSGKSTLLHLLGAMDRPTTGTVIVDGVDTADGSDTDLTVLRRRRLGFVFQFFHLLPSLSAVENVAVPAMLDGVSLRRASAEARDLLQRVGLGGREDHRPSELSGGELQRVAIARALVGDPAVVLADEPTGNLDSDTGASVLEALRSCTVDAGRTLVVVTHDQQVAAVTDRTLTLRDGRLIEPVPAHG